MIILFCHGYGFKTDNLLLKVSARECLCLGDTVTYECTVFSGIEVTTIWKGDFLNNGTNAVHNTHI
jgi:hypothetical protein